ncbi:hypothetical protein V6N11_031373 [Hibiscus sabdariffa]|uniref:RNase H type-1 domain-containing protein n=1 Tax=Hibiscus sabdariffa TaxID=183260 RepID=A0ABR2SYB2_9ROSI
MMFCSRAGISIVLQRDLSAFMEAWGAFPFLWWGVEGKGGEILFQFSKLRGSGPPALIELLAINVGMLNFLESEWDDKFRLIIECDCKLIVESLSMSVNPPISFYSLVSELMGTIRERGMSLRWIPRSADALAKSEIMVRDQQVLGEMADQSSTETAQGSIVS